MKLWAIDGGHCLVGEETLPKFFTKKRKAFEWLQRHNMPEHWRPIRVSLTVRVLTRGDISPPNVMVEFPD